jgi:hypothetical protein
MHETEAMASEAAPRNEVDSAARLIAVGLAAGRLAIGAGIWLAPGLSARALGFGTLEAKALALGRVAATRDLVLGGWQLASLGERGQLRRAAGAGAMVDAGDTLAFGLLLGAGAELRPAALRGLAAAGAATAAGHWLSRRLG